MVPFDQLASAAERFDGFVFDCDGTLADTMPLHHQAWLHALGGTQAPFHFDWELFVRRAGMSLEHTVAELNVEFGTSLDPASVARAQREYFEQNLGLVTPIQPVLDFARRVAPTHPVSVASGSPLEHVIHTLELIGARELFDIIVTPKDVASGKPAPDMFLLAAARMGVLPERCLVLEDSMLGVLAASRAGMHALLVPPSSSVAIEVSEAS